MKRLVEHCHFARNDPNHQCFGAWGLKREWYDEYEYCELCQKRTGQRGPPYLNTERRGKPASTSVVLKTREVYVCLASM